MPRQARRLSSSGIYHVVVRGINKEDICLEAQDYSCFLAVLRKYKDECGFILYSYCLMSNHAHFLLNPGDNSLGTVMSRILVSFSMYYNSKYARSGHVFQNRYFSDPVESEASFLNVVKYIVYNPVKAGICSSPEEYSWCSFNAYLGHDDKLTETEMLSGIFPNVTKLIEFLFDVPGDENNIPEYLPRVRYSDEEARKRLMDISGCTTPADFRALSRLQRIDCIKALRKLKISLRQIGRITGLTKDTVSGYLKQK